MTDLGCGRIGVALTTRAAPTTPVADLRKPLLSAECDRRLSAVSEASLTLDPCYDGPPIVPWYHYLQFTWEDDILWTGPVTSVGQTAAGDGVVKAHDNMIWMTKRKLRDTIDTIAVPIDASLIWETMVSDGFAQDASVSVTIDRYGTTYNAGRLFALTDHEYVTDMLTELTNAGCPWTVIGNRIVVGDLGSVVGGIGNIDTSLLYEPPEMTISGLDMANFATVKGQGSALGLRQLVSSQTTYGLLDIIETEGDIPSDTQCDEAADARLTLRSLPTLSISDLRIRPTAPFNHNTQMVPSGYFGFATESPFLDVVPLMKIETVTFTADTQAGHWGVRLAAVPFQFEVAYAAGTGM